MSPTLLSTLALLLVSFTHNANAGWRVEAINLLIARMDPLLYPNAVAPHVHLVGGGSKFSTTYDYDTLRQSDCTTNVIPDDKSTYWTPAVYYKHRNTSKLELVPSEWGMWYYHRGTEQPNIRQFPAGFRMIAGSDTRSSLGSTLADQAINYFCMANVVPSDPLTYTLPMRQCDKGVIMNIIFPSCWNGIDATSPNFMDHVSYPLGTTPEGGTCPPTHPVRLMTLHVEQVLHTERFEYYDGGFILSTGDNVGYSSYGGFTNGWDASENSILQQAINICTDPASSMSNCTVLRSLTNYDSSNYCRPESQMPIEDVGLYGGLEKLPGDNPIWGGNVKKVPTGVSNNPPFGSPYSTLPANWEEYGCIDEGNGGVNAMVGDKWVDPGMYPGLCVRYCILKGFSLAGLEAGQECYCANALTNGGSMNLITKNQCNSVCGGSRYEFCGANGKINLYKESGNSTSPINGPIYPPAGSNLTGSIFTAPNLPNPDPTGSDLTGPHLTDSNITDSNITGLNITGSKNITRAHTSGASRRAVALSVRWRW